jgi:peroxiredoxin
MVCVLCACQSMASLPGRPEQNQAPEPRALDTTPVIIAGRPLLAGEKAPDFRLDNASGTTVRLADELRAGSPVVLIFYTNHYCRICLDLLRALEAKRPAWQTSGARLIAIAHQSVDEAAASARQASASYAFLADNDGRAAREYGIWPFLPGRNKNRQSPVMVFIVERSGVIRWAGPGLVNSQPAIEIILSQLPR